MAQHTRAGRPAASERRDGGGKLLAVHFATALLVVVDFVMFQAVAAGVTAAIYYTVPALDAGIMRGESSWTWIRIFQIVSPTIALPGGAATMLSSYFLARRVQQVETQARADVQQAQDQARAEAQRAQDQARAEAQRAQDQARAEAQRAQEAETRIQEEAQRARDESQRAQEQARRAEAAEARAENLQAQLERSRSPRRRRLRNAAALPPAAR